MHDTVIVRYGEIFLKSDPVRKIFVNRLLDNIRFALSADGIDFKFVLGRHRIFIKTTEPALVAERVCDIFGVKSTSPCSKSPLDEVSNTAQILAEKVLKPGDSFAVRVKKGASKNVSSKKLEIELGDRIRSSLDVSVDLENPSETIFIEISDDNVYVFNEKIEGIGGMPYATQGRVLALLDDADDLLAALMLMRRGTSIVGMSASKRVKDVLSYYANEDIIFVDIKLDDIGDSKSTAVKFKCNALVCGESKHILASDIIVFQPLIGLTDSEIKKWELKFVQIAKARM